MSSVLADKANSLEGIGVSVTKSGLLNVSKGGLPGAIRDAHSCDISAPEDGFDLSCSWYFTKAEAKDAARTFERLRARLENCLPSRFEQDAPVQWSDEKLEEFAVKYGPSFVQNIKNTNRLQDLSADIELDNGDDVDISLGLSSRNDSGRHNIRLSIYRD